LNGSICAIRAATGEGAAKVGVGAAVGVGGAVGVAGGGGFGSVVRDGGGVAVVGVPEIGLEVLPAACGDSAGEGTALPSPRGETPPEPGRGPQAARTTKPTRHVDAARLNDFTR